MFGNTVSGIGAIKWTGGAIADKIDRIKLTPGDTRGSVKWGASGTTSIGMLGLSMQGSSDYVVREHIAENVSTHLDRYFKKETVSQISRDVTSHWAIDKIAKKYLRDELPPELVDRMIKLEKAKWNPYLKKAFRTAKETDTAQNILIARGLWLRALLEQTNVKDLPTRLQEIKEYESHIKIALERNAEIIAAEHKIAEVKAENNAAKAQSAARIKAIEDEAAASLLKLRLDQLKKRLDHEERSSEQVRKLQTETH